MAIAIILTACLAAALARVAAAFGAKGGKENTVKAGAWALASVTVAWVLAVLVVLLVRVP